MDHAGEEIDDRDDARIRTLGAHVCDRRIAQGMINGGGFSTQFGLRLNKCIGPVRVARSMPSICAGIYPTVEDWCANRAKVACMDGCQVARPCISKIM